MDTITLCHVSDNNGIWDANYAALLVTQPPAGCCIWTKKLSGLAVACIWIKINCHDVLRNLNTTQEDIDQLTEIIRDWLGKYDIAMDDFHVNRVDYDYNTICQAPEIILDILQQTPERAMRMDRTVYYHYSNISTGNTDNTEIEDARVQTVYYACKSRHAQVYDKEAERDAKHRQPKEWEFGVLRQEVQCHHAHIKHMKRYYGLLPSWDNWITLQMQEMYLRNTEAMFPHEDFYSILVAKNIVNASPYGTAKKRKLCEDLELVASSGLFSLKQAYKSTNTYKDHLKCFEELGINPMTIPEKYGIDHLENPLFR